MCLVLRAATLYEGEFEGEGLAIAPERRLVDDGKRCAALDVVFGAKALFIREGV